MESTSPLPQGNPLIIDTCIIQYMGKSNTSLSKGLADCLSNLQTEGYELTISEITFYENLHGLWGVKFEKADELLRTYEYKPVSRLVLVAAAALGGLYHEEKIDGIDTGDKIIAATALIEKGFVLTANHKDFPPPFFTTELSIAIPYTVGHYKKTLDIAIYKPNFTLIGRRLDENLIESKRRK